ncbi:hypothetical protein EII20_12655 [Comamonadaceae bacterium OH2545_COT-014]|nr:hypothetical protein EII20_12655 [Comamonadaceae bacterium OH2545_COT-014]
MSRDSSSGGLLAKVVKFVKNPATDWADLDRPDSESGADETRQALKEMIERKRRNDFVRNREFDMLRKVRRREITAGQEGVAHASFYVSSLPASTDDRARTLEKIDEIEEQMSSTWFKRKDAPSSAVSVPASAPSAPATRSVPLGEMPSDLANAFAPTEPMQHADAPAEEGAPALVPTPAAPVLAPVPSLPVEAPRPAPARALPSTLATFGFEGDFNVEVTAETAQDPELEESAIRFANGDMIGAEAGLLALVSEGGARPDHMETWLCLFDFYRATAQQAKFDAAAEDFASRFGRSAPQWGVLTQEAVEALSAQPATATAAASAAVAQWVAPSVMTVQSVAALKAVLGRQSPPWRIDWRYLKSIDPAALPAFIDVLQQWGDSRADVKFIGGEQLLQLLVDHSPTDDQGVDPQWWTARLALLRLMGEMDEFDLVALNYCVTYEVSPPAWQDPQCRYSAMTPEGNTIAPEKDAVAAEDVRDVHPAFAQTVPPTPGDHVAQLHEGHLKASLRGEILDDATRALAPVDAQVGRAQTIELNCRQLLRVDFGAAGTLLNWAAERQSKGQKVMFTQLNRLIAVFFGVVGIQDVARVVPRQD